MSHVSIPNGPTPTIDLHGLRLPNAVAKTTTFLADVVKIHTRACCLHHCHCFVPCVIITGSGSHSTATGGSVLRSGIANLLTRRQINFWITPNSGKGSFSVNANSGVELYRDVEGQKSDTKVLIRDAPDESWPDLPAVIAGRAKEAGKRQFASFAAINHRGDEIRSLANVNEVAERERALGDYPLPREISEDDAVVSNAKTLSAFEANQNKGYKIKEVNVIKEIIKISKEESLRFKEMENSELDELKEVMTLSLKIEESTNTFVDDEEFEKLLEVSRNEEAEKRRLEDEREKDDLERALSLINDLDHDIMGGDGDTDEDLKRALSLSAEMEKAIQESLALAVEDGVVGSKPDGVAASGDGLLDEVKEAEVMRKAILFSLLVKKDLKMVEQTLEVAHSDQSDDTANLSELLKRDICTEST